MKTFKLMADYHSYPLWKASDGEVGNVDPESLPISEILKTQLRKWADDYDATLNLSDPASSGFADILDKQKFQAEGMRLAEHLQKELNGQFHVIYANY